MKAIVKATGEIVDIIRNSAFDKDVFYDSNGQKYNREELSFDFKEKSFPKDEDYWTRLEHTYAGMAMQGLLNNNLLSSILLKTWTTHEDYINEVVNVADEYAKALITKIKMFEDMRRRKMYYCVATKKWYPVVYKVR